LSAVLEAQRVVTLPAPVDILHPDTVAYLDGLTYPVTVKVASAMFAFPKYHVDGTPYGHRYAYKGDIIDLFRTELELGMAHGNLIDPDAPLPGTPTIALDNDDLADRDGVDVDVEDDAPHIDSTGTVIVAPGTPSVVPGDALTVPTVPAEHIGADGTIYDRAGLVELVRSSSVSEILSKVGDDPDLADAVLDVEADIAGTSGRPLRKTLVGDLDLIIADAADEAPDADEA
jgi:hypothetical protein